MDDGIGLAEALLRLDGFRVLAVTEGPDELVVTVESTAWWAIPAAVRGPRLRIVCRSMSVISPASAAPAG